MKKIEIYDPAMCCSTGVCGPSIDQELLRVATLIDNLTKNGADITRYNLSSEPQAFVSNEEVKRLLSEDNDILPITVVDGKVVKTKEYLTNEEFSFYTNIITVTQPIKASCCTPEEAKQTGCCSTVETTEECSGDSKEGCY